VGKKKKQEKRRTSLQEGLLIKTKTKTYLLRIKLKLIYEDLDRYQVGAEPPSKSDTQVNVRHEYWCVCPMWCHWTPGPPDVEQPCDPSLQAWSPELSLYDTNLTSPCPDTEGCTLTLSFLHPIVPRTLTLWITYVSSSKCHSITRMVATCGSAEGSRWRSVFTDQQAAAPVVV